PLDEHHSHVVLAPSDHWGGETETLFMLAEWLAEPASAERDETPPAPAQPAVPVVLVLANGGDISTNEVLAGVRHGWPIVVIEGSGGLADEIAGYHRAAPAQGVTIDDPVLAEIVDDGDLSFFPLQASVDGLTRLLTQRLHP